MVQQAEGGQGGEVILSVRGGEGGGARLGRGGQAVGKWWVRSGGGADQGDQEDQD